MKKIIFLDIDGVMITDFKPVGWWKVNPECLKNLRLLVDAGAKIVISSSWRRTQFIDTLEDLAQIGLGSDLPIIDQTPDGGNHPRGITVSRGSEIRHWVKQHLTEQDQWIILDDEQDILINQSGHFFKTETKFGLTQEITDQILEYFRSGIRNKIGPDTHGASQFVLLNAC